MSDVGKKYGYGRTALSVMTCWKRFEFMEEFQKSLTDLDWIRGILSGLSGCGEDVTEDVVICAAVTLTLCSVGAFETRVVEPMSGYPFQFLCLCPDEAPEVRLRAADALVNPPGGKLGITPMKFVDFHRDELMDTIAAEGHCGPEPTWMTASTLALREQLDASAHDIESGNKIITHETANAPGQNPILTAARLTIKTAINAETGCENPKQMIQRMQVVSDAAQAHYKTQEYKELTSDPNRFMLPGQTTVNLVPLHDFNKADASANLPLGWLEDGAHAADPDAADAVHAAHGGHEGAMAVEAAAAAEPGVAPEAPEAAMDVEAAAAPAGAAAIVPVLPAGQPAFGHEEVLAAWKRAWNLKWARATPKSGLLLTARYAILTENETLGRFWWVACSKLNFDGRLHQLQPARSGASDLELVLPLRSVLSAEVIGRVRKHAVREPVRLYRVPLTWRLQGDQLLASFSIDDKLHLFDIWASIEKTIESCVSSKDDLLALGGAAGPAEAAGAEAAPDAAPDGADGADGAPKPKKRRAYRPRSSGPRKLTALELLKKYLRVAGAAEPGDPSVDDAEDGNILEMELAGLIEEMGEDGMDVADVDVPPGEAGEAGDAGGDGGAPAAPAAPAAEAAEEEVAGAADALVHQDQPASPHLSNE